ncbi:hypothetical protein [Microbispora sp. NPDC049125]|uniref:hypothetical protein n=1 Tax=Microbispora sp. NPDC049125 TaxID=3154929 RepID=UPI003466FDDB
MAIAVVMVAGLGVAVAPGASAATSGLWATAIGKNEDGRLEVVAFNSTDVLYTNHQLAGGGWSGWQARAHIPNSFVVNGPIVRSNKDGRMEIFAGTADGRLYHMWQLSKNSGSWSGWAQIDQFSMMTGLSAVVNLDGRLEVFVADGFYVWSVYQTSPGVGWEKANLGHVLTWNANGPVVAARNSDGRLEVFGVGCGIATPTNECGIPHIYHKWQKVVGGDWSGWEPMGHCNDRTVTSVNVAQNKDGRLEFYEIRTTSTDYLKGDLCATWQQPDGTWHAYENRGNGRIDTQAPTAVASNEDGRIEVFSISADNHVQHMWQTAANGGWSGWANLGTRGDFGRLGLAANRNADGRLEVVALTSNGQPYHSWQKTAGGDWSDWAPLEAADSPVTYNVLDFYLTDDQNSGAATRPVFQYGNSPMVPITGDWDGDGKDTVSTYDPTSGRFFISNTPATGAAQYTFVYGNPNAVPFVGDWDGDGKDNVGVRMGYTFFMRTSPVTTATETTQSVAYGDAPMVPLVGDWDGDGKDTVSAYDPGTGRFLLSNNPATGAAQYSFLYGNANAVPFVGDWDGDGKDNVGVRMGYTFFMRTSPVTTATETTHSVAYGDAGDLPVIGDWDGDGKDSQGIVR